MMLVGTSLLALNAHAMDDHEDRLHPVRQVLSDTSDGLAKPTHKPPLQALPPYDWSKNFNVTMTHEVTAGHQILHTHTADKPYEESPLAKEFVNTHLQSAKPLTSDADVLRYGVEAAKLPGGFFLELGVGMARTINFIAALKPREIIHGFDSFEGLPEDWDKGNIVRQKGTFALKNASFMPPLVKNIRVYKGLFEDVLPQFKEEILKGTPISFLNVDCDSYTSTKNAFAVLGANIHPGTILFFDELYNYPTYAQHEWKALQEFLKETGYKAEFLAYNTNHEQVVVRIR